MPRRSKGPRLYLRPARPAQGSGEVYVIRDGPNEISTGCGPDSLPDAERALTKYLAGKYTPAARSGDPAKVPIADVLTLYAVEKAPTLVDPASVGLWVEHLLLWWGDKACADIKRSTCNAYVKHRTSQPKRSAKTAEARKVMVSAQTARRELETLGAAVGYWDKETPFDRRPMVVLPPKPESPRDALTRPQAAALLKAAMGFRWIPATATTAAHWRRLPKEVATQRAHLRRFLLIGFYTGSRAGVVNKLLWRESPKDAWADVEKGIIYRRGKEEADIATKRRPLCKMPPRLIAHMKRWQAADLKMEAEAAAKHQELVVSAVIHHTTGMPLAGPVRTGFTSIVRDAGLSPEITPHWMRHTAATWLMEAGVDIWAAAGYLGMTAKTLEKCYGHHRASHQSSARHAHSRR